MPHVFRRHRSPITVAARWVAALVGCSGLWAAPLVAQNIQGRVIDGAAERPVTSGVIVLLDTRGDPVARARVRPDGSFSLEAPTAGRYAVRFEAPGFLAARSDWLELRTGLTFAVTLRASPIRPTELDTVFVRGEPVPARLAPFYERRARGFGEFFTREDMERRGVKEVTDVLRTSLYFNVVPNPAFLRGAGPREFVIVNRRLSQVQQAICPPLIFVDGVYAGNATDVDVDAYFDGTWLDGVEAYAGPATVPVEYSRNGSECGVIILWSRWTQDIGPRTSRALHLGAQAGASVRGPFGGEQLGAHAVVRPAGPLEFGTAFAAAFDAEAEWQWIGWQLSMAVRVRPLGANGPWYLGIGGAVVDRTSPNVRPAERRPAGDQFLMLLTGVSANLGRSRPFVELDVLDPFGGDIREVQIYVGISYRAY